MMLWRGISVLHRHPAVPSCAVPGDFTDLVAWQEALVLAGKVARLARRVRGAGSYDFAMQMVRAAESVPANIAEGYGRGLGRDFERFLRIAAASAAELESHLRVGAVTERLRQEDASPIIARARRVRALIRGLGKAVAKRADPALRRPITHS